MKHFLLHYTALLNAELNDEQPIQNGANSLSLGERGIVLGDFYNLIFIISRREIKPCVTIRGDCLGDKISAKFSLL